MAGILVVIGAGASYDCADNDSGSVDVDYRPPLVNQLVENRRAFNHILRKYPKAEALSVRIRDHIRKTAELEPLLRQLASSENIYIRRQYFQIPLYLQEIIGEVSQRYVTGGATRFDTLVADLAQSKYDHILYVSVNYDLFLERALAGLYDVRFNDIDDYCKDGRRWALVKLHGTVTWGRRLLNGIDIGPENPFVSIDGEPQLDSEIVILNGYHSSSRVRGNHFYYPSLAVPLGAKDLACPPAHLTMLNDRIGDCSAVILIGFSAMEEHVVKLLAGLKNVTRIAVVNGPNNVHAQAPLERCARHHDCFKVGVPADVSYGGFSTFIAQGRLPQCLSVV